MARRKEVKKLSLHIVNEATGISGGHILSFFATIASTVSTD
jgi:hypothetical protein